jgi:hypothetical protein
MGVLCAVCEAELVPSEGCPERGCPGRHGHTFQTPSEWAAKTWPQHPCFKPAT